MRVQDTIWKERARNDIKEQFKDYLRFTEEQASLFVEPWLEHT
jgi:plasmid stabilization system protein ParE